MPNQNKTKLIERLIGRNLTVTSAAKALNISVDKFLNKAQKNDFDIDDLVLIANELGYTIMFMNKDPNIRTIDIDVNEFFQDDPINSRRLEKAHAEYMKKKQKRIEELQKELEKEKAELQKEMKDEKDI